MGNNPSKKKKKSKVADPTPSSPSTSEPEPRPPHTSPLASNPSALLQPPKSESQPVSKSSSFVPLKSDGDKNGFSMKRLEEMFEHYKDPEGHQIGPGGVEALCGDLGVEPEDVVVLVLAWHLNAQNMGYFKREEFIDGLQKLGVDSPQKLKNQLPNFRKDLEDQSKFKEIYRYAFFFAKEKDQKILDLTTADAMLGLVLGNRFPHTEPFRQFLKEQTSYKSVNLDQWLSILEFSKTIKPDLSNYDENGAWPVLLDEYCEWVRTHTGQSS
jgi:DCN1-like protein 4/5